MAGIPPKGIGPGCGMGPGRGLGAGKSMGPGRIGRRRSGPSGKDPSLLKKGLGPFGHGRLPNADKDGDPFTKRSPWKKPGNNSFF
ncbi:MAG: hypothetical protein ACFB50_13890 [Rubrobacteraceae bacterium]